MKQPPLIIKWFIIAAALAATYVIGPFADWIEKLLM